MNSLQKKIEKIKKGMLTLKLGKNEINDLVELMAYISETSFRRGFHHGCDFEKRGVSHVDAYEFRYKRKLSLAPYTMLDTKGRADPNKWKTALWRFEAEYGMYLYGTGLSYTKGVKLSCKSGIEIQLKDAVDANVKLMIKHEEYKNKIKEYESITGIKL